METTLHLVKPTRNFGQFKLSLNDKNEVESYSAPVDNVASEDPFLKYQQWNTILHEDLIKAKALYPQVLRALEIRAGLGSWEHPVGPIHRAMVFFIQGYIFGRGELSLILWAAGIDCLFASRNERGAQVIADRLKRFLGEKFEPYQAVNPKPKRSPLQLDSIARDIFLLRNAYMHGEPIPSGEWLSKENEPIEHGYGYQLLECTEIILRECLMRILYQEETVEIFRDKEKLRGYFN